MSYTENSRKLVPPTIAFGHELSAFGPQTLIDSISGDLTDSVTGTGMGVMKAAGKIRQVYFMLLDGDQSLALELSCEVDVKINGTSCCTVKPKISYATGEVGGEKSTLVSGEFDGVIVADLDDDNRTFTRNDRISYDATVVAGGTPVTEMTGFCVTVELEPILPT